MKTEVTKLTLDTEDWGLTSQITIQRMPDNVVTHHPMPPLASDLPLDFRVALMRWLVEGLPREQRDRWPDIGLPGDPKDSQR